MEVEAIYENGKLEFVQPLRLKHARVRLLVNVPDHEVDEVQASDLSHLNLPADVVERAKATLARMEAIKNAPVPEDEELPELTEKQLERLAGSALRDEIKGMR